MQIFLIILLAVISSIFITRAYKNTKDIIINNVIVDQNHPNEQAPTMKILQLSDLHLENISITPEELYDKLKNDPIDLITITGDFLDRKRTIPKLTPYLQTLQRLSPKYGIYAVLGNHDYVLKPRHLQALTGLLEAHYCKVLQNEHKSIFVHGKQVNIIGIDDFSTKRSCLTNSYKGIQTGINLVITHDPNIVLHMKNHHFDYLLSGHFHGGQICYPKAYHLVKMGKLARMNIIKGLHKLDGKPFYISEGLGQTGVNIRIGSRPEITIHEFTLQSINKQVQEAIS